MCAIGLTSLSCRGVDRSTLDPLMEADLSRFAPQIQQQLTDQRSKTEELLAGSTTDEVLARAFGELGRHYHAYGLHPPAKIAYRNASLLAPQEPRWTYLQGVIAQTDGELAAAADLFQRSRQQLQGADDEAALATDLRQVEVLSDLNRAAEAEQLARQILQRNDAVAVAHFHLGRLASSRGDTREAIDHFERTLELQPKATTVHYLLGVAYRRLGEGDKAQHHIDAMGAVGPAFKDPWVTELKALVLGIGPLLDAAQEAVEGGRFEDAKRDYRAALEIDPKSSTALRGLGYTLRKAGELTAAVEVLRGLIDMDPDDTAARLELATTLLEQGELEAAVREFEATLEVDPSFELAYLNLGVTRSRQGRWNEAQAMFDKVLELSPKHAKARFHLAVTLDELGHEEESLEMLRALALELPQWVEVRQRLGLELLKRGELEAAAQEHRAVIGNADAPDQEKALAHYQLAQIAERQGDLQGALDGYGQARQLFPELWQAGLSFGNTLRRAGNFAAAAAEYRRLVQKEPTTVHYRQLEIQSLMQAGDFTQAARRLEEGLGQLPRAAELGHLKARLLASAPDDRLRNGDLALDMAQQIFQRFPTLEHGETLAMAWAETRQFGEAMKLQQQLLSQAERQGRSDLLPRLRRNFETYRRAEPARGW